MSRIPSQIVDFSLYKGTNRLIGHGDELTLPTIVSKTITADLTGGDMDLPSMRTENIEIEIPFNVFDMEAASTISVTDTTTLTIRTAAQSVDTSTHSFDYSGTTITTKGFAKEVDLGKVKRSEKNDSKIKMTLSYIEVKRSTDGFVYIKIDKLNGTYIINGKDVRAGISKYL